MRFADEILKMKPVPVITTVRASVKLKFLKMNVLKLNSPHGFSGGFLPFLFLLKFSLMNVCTSLSL